MFLQLWHVGRVSHPDFLNGELPLSASATQMNGKMPRDPERHYGWSRAMSLDDIKQVIDDYATAASNAIKAGFDGVEIHGANGYLVDQFLHHHTNHRDDEYGGDTQRMTRFAIEVTQAVGETVGYDRTAIRLSPAAYINDMKEDPRDTAVQSHLLEQLNDLPIAYIHTGTFDDSVCYESLDGLSMTAFLRQYYQGNLIGCGSYSLESGKTAIEAKQFDLLAIGRPFIANPDLVVRYTSQHDLVTYDAAMLGTLD